MDVSLSYVRSFVAWFDGLGVDEPLVDVLIPLALDDLDVLRVPRLDRAHERFRLAVTPHHTSAYHNTNTTREDTATYLPIAFPV